MDQQALQEKDQLEVLAMDPLEVLAVDQLEHLVLLEEKVALVVLVTLLESPEVSNKSAPSLCFPH